MKTSNKIKTLMEHGFKPSTLFKLNEGQIQALYIRLMESTPVNAPNANQTQVSQTVTTLNPGQTATLPGSGGTVKITNKDNKVEIMSGEMGEGTESSSKKKKNEVKEKSVSKQQQKFFGVVRGMQKGDIPKKGNAGKAAKKMSKKDVKDFASTKHKGLPQKKETKESYADMVMGAVQNNYRLGTDKFVPGVNFSSALEESIKNMVDKHITPKISKREFLKYLLETKKNSDTKEAPTKPKTDPKIKPNTEPKPKETPYRREREKDAPSPSPKAKKTETKESSMNAPATKPKTPTIKPGTKPKPKTPPSPYTIPGPAPAPKAKKGNIPSWLSYDSIGLNLK